MTLAPLPTIDPANLLRLTGRESEIFELIGLGYSKPEIATALRITVATVSIHVDRIHHKLGIGRAAQIVRYVAQRDAVAGRGPA